MGVRQTASYSRRQLLLKMFQQAQQGARAGRAPGRLGQLFMMLDPLAATESDSCVFEPWVLLSGHADFGFLCTGSYYNKYIPLVLVG